MCVLISRPYLALLEPAPRLHGLFCSVVLPWSWRKHAFVLLHARTLLPAVPAHDDSFLVLCVVPHFPSRTTVSLHSLALLQLLPASIVVLAVAVGAPLLAFELQGRVCVGAVGHAQRIVHEYSAIHRRE